MPIKKPLGRVVGMWLWQPVRKSLGCDFTPAIQLEGNLRKGRVRYVEFLFYVSYGRDKLIARAKAPQCGNVCGIARNKSCNIRVKLVSKISRDRERAHLTNRNPRSPPNRTAPLIGIVQS